MASAASAAITKWAELLQQQEKEEAEEKAANMTAVLLLLKHLMEAAKPRPASCRAAVRAYCSGYDPFELRPTAHGFSSAYYHERYPTPLLVDFLKEDKSDYIVSVGSGLGVREYAVKQALPNLRMICVDPSPRSFADHWTDEVKFPPRYEYVVECIKKQPEVVNNCTLLLLHPLPNDSIYDVDAIAALKPNRIIIGYEETGSAGSYQLHEWMHQVDARNKAEEKTQREVDMRRKIRLHLDVSQRPIQPLSPDWTVSRDYLDARPREFIFRLVRLEKGRPAAGYTVKDRVWMS